MLWCTSSAHGGKRFVIVRDVVVTCTAKPEHFVSPIPPPPPPLGGFVGGVLGCFRYAGTERKGGRGGGGSSSGGGCNRVIEERLVLGRAAGEQNGIYSIDAQNV